MTKTAFLPLLAATVLLAACGASTERFAVPPVAVADKMRISFASVAVRDVSLPTYAASEEIYRRTPEGSLTSSSDLLWADDPVRAVTLELTRYLTQMTGARVASEPWPYADYPDATVEVRLEQMLADADGRFRLSGQYFVAPAEGRRARSGLFDLAEPIAPEGGVPAIAAARGGAVLQLVRLIARDGLR